MRTLPIVLVALRHAPDATWPKWSGGRRRVSTGAPSIRPVDRRSRNDRRQASAILDLESIRRSCQGPLDQRRLPSTNLLSTLEVEGDRAARAILQASMRREAVMKDLFYDAGARPTASQKWPSDSAGTISMGGYDRRGVSTLGNFVAELAVAERLQVFIAAFAGVAKSRSAARRVTSTSAATIQLSRIWLRSLAILGDGLRSPPFAPGASSPPSREAVSRRGEPTVLGRYLRRDPLLSGSHSAGELSHPRSRAAA